MMLRRMIPRVAATLGACLTLGAAAASAQTLRGQIVEEATGAPVLGALVVLLDDAGAQAAGSLSDAAGRFVVRAPRPGRYAVRVQRIGFADGTVPSLTLAADETASRTISLRSQVIALEGIAVEARRRRCTVRPRDGLLVAELWDEARKALRAVEFSERQEHFALQVRQYRRVLDAATLTVREDSSRIRESYRHDSPYASLPVDSLLRAGFIQGRRDGLQYYAPDAHTLLSDPFLDAYCFRLADSGPATGGLVGISFEPVARSGPPAVRGTLWLDRESYELRWLEYGYTRTPSPIERDTRVGGRVEFELLPSGAWIVRRWHIRMPRSVTDASVTRVGVREPSTLASLIEEGAEILEIRAAGGERRRLVEEAVVTGVVYDSTRARPLPGAFVYISGTSYADTADAEGRFRIGGLPAGEFGISFTHDDLTPFGIVVQPKPVRLTAGGSVELALAVPAGARLHALAALCDGERGHGGQTRGVLAGRVTDERTGEPLVGARVRVAWVGRTIDQGQQFQTVTTGPGGVYVACGLPLNRTLQVGASHQATRVEPVLVQELADAGEHPVVEHDLVLRVSRGRPVVLALQDWETGQPIAGAAVSIPALRVQAVSDRQGRVRFDGVPAGRHRLDLQHVAYERVSDEIEITSDAAEFEVRVPRTVLQVEGVRVTARAAVDRARVASGTSMALMTRADIERTGMAARNAADVARRLPGIKARDVYYNNAPGILKEVCLESSRGGGLPAPHEDPDCPARILVVIDEIATFDPAPLLSMPLSSIESMEFLNSIDGGRRYGSAGMRGVLVVYTRGRGPYARSDGR